MKGAYNQKVAQKYFANDVFNCYRLTLAERTRSIAFCKIEINFNVNAFLRRAEQTFCLPCISGHFDAFFEV